MTVWFTTRTERNMGGERRRGLVMAFPTRTTLDMEVRGGKADGKTDRDTVSRTQEER